MTDSSLLSLLQLTDSQFPIGSFAHSNGLETYAQMDISKEQLAELLTTQLGLGFGRLDLAACALAYAATSAEQLDTLSAELSAWKPVKGLRDTSLKLGKRLLNLATRLYPELEHPDLTAPHQALVLGDLARQLGIDKEALLLAFAQSTVLSQLQAATRCMPLSPEQAQEILVKLQPLIADVVARVLENPAKHFWSATPALDIRAQQQAFLYTRLFQS